MAAAGDLTHDDVQVFFLGFGEADYQRSGASWPRPPERRAPGLADEDLAAVIEALSGYF